MPQRSGGASSVEYFDAVAETYARRYVRPTADGHALRERRRRLLELLPRSPGRVLDVGCGPAILADDVVERGGEFWGVDAAVHVVAAGLRRVDGNAGVHLLASDGARLPFRDASFDTVVCLGVIDRVPDRAAFLDEIRRVLRPGGQALISFPNGLSPYALWRSYVFLPTLRVLRSLIGSRRAPPTRPAMLWSVALPTPRSARALVGQRLGTVESTTYYYFNPLLSPIDEIAPTLAYALTRRLERLRSTPLRLLANGYIVQARVVPDPANATG